MRQVPVVLIVLLAAAACQPKAESARESAATAAKPATSPAASAEAPAPAGEIGVPECDKYLARWDECLATKVPAEARETVKVALDAQREMWKATAAKPEGRAGLAAACAEAAELARMQLPSYGCTY